MASHESQQQLFDDDAPDTGGSGGGTGSNGGHRQKAPVIRNQELQRPSETLHQPLLATHADDTPETAIVSLRDELHNGHHTDHDADLTPLVPVVLTWQDIQFSVPKPQGGMLHILRGVSGVAGHVPADDSVRNGTADAVTASAGHWETTTGGSPRSPLPQSFGAGSGGAGADGSHATPGTPAAAGNGTRSASVTPGSFSSKHRVGGTSDAGSEADRSVGHTAQAGGHTSQHSLAGSDHAGRAGSMFAILGPSGAGKTTLLDILSGRRYGMGVTGEVRLNGHLVDPGRMKSMCGYVMQDDVLPGTLTTYEYLLFSAALKLPPPSAERPASHSRQVWTIIRQLGLSKVAHSFIGDAFVRGLSGGEKRRVSIAVELLTRPGVLMLDEPTTGLDSTNAARVVDIMSSLARAGVTVLMSIHQPRPDIFRLMDRVLLLSGNGEAVYSGPVASALQHLGELGAPAPGPGVAVPDFMLDLVIRSPRQAVVDLVDAFKGSRVANHDEVLALRLAESPVDLPAPKYCAPVTTQLACLSGRLLRNTYRHPFLVGLNFTATLCAAIAVGLIFKHSGTDTGGIQNRLGVLFFCLLYLALMTLSSLPVWREERLLYLRERDTGAYGTPAYFTAVMLFELLPLRVIPPFFFALFAYWIIGLHPGCAMCLLLFVWLLVAANVTSTTMCMAIGAASPSNSVANLVASMVMMGFMLFGGFLLNKERVPVYCRWVAAASFFNYAYEGLAVNEFHKYPGDFYFTAPLNTTILPPLRITGDGVLKEFGFDMDKLWMDCWMLVGLTLANCVSTYVVLALMGTPRAEQLSAGLHKLRVTIKAGLMRLFARATGYPLGPREGDELPSHSTSHSRIRGRSASARSSYFRRTGGSPTGHSGRGSIDAGHTNGSDGHSAANVNDQGGPFVTAQLPSATAAHADEDQVFAPVSPHDFLPMVPGANAPAGHQQHLPEQQPGGEGGEEREGAGERQPLLHAMSSVSSAQEFRLQVTGPPCVLSWENVTVHVTLPGGRQRYILQSVCGVAGPTATDTGTVGHAAHHAHMSGGVSSPTGRSSPTKLNLARRSAGRRSVLAPEAVQPSCLFAILGPSGAGKTTLLDILSGRKHGHSVSGEVRANGRLLTALQLRRMAGYVQQDAVLPGTSTVREYLTFHGSLRMPYGTPQEQVEQRVSDVLSELDLGKVAHSFIGDAFVRGLSGGEKRRVSIAVELLTRPGVLMLDEPTTGLDSTNAARVVDIMSSLARAGVTVLMSIHQPRPDIFRLMDRILLMSSDGQVVFSGPTSLASEYFAALGYVAPSPSMSIADYVLDLVIKAPPSTVSQLLAAWSRSEVARHDAAWVERLALDAAMAHGAAPAGGGGGGGGQQAGGGDADDIVPHKYEAPYTAQVKALAGRLAANAVRHPLLLALNWASTAVIALGIGAVYWDAGMDTGGIQDRFGSLFFQLLYLALVGLSSLPIWADDRLLFLRERAAGAYGTDAYFTAVVLFDVLPMRVLPPFFFVIFSYWMIGLRAHGLYWLKTLLVLVLSNITSTSLSMAIGAASPSVALANMFGSLSLLLSMLFGGFLLSRNKMPGWIGWAANLSYVRYAFEALVNNEFHGTTGYRFTAFAPPGARHDQIPHVDVTGDEVLMTFGFTLGAYWKDCAALLCLSAVFLTTTFLLLKYKQR